MHTQQQIIDHAVLAALSSREALAAKKNIDHAVLSRIKSATDYPYRVSKSRWAGGNHSTTFYFSDSPRCSGASHRVWSSNRKWSGNDSSASLHITRRAYMLFGENLNIGGLVTLDAEQVGHREYRAVWARQSRGFDLKTESGWIIRGHHVVGGTLAAARKKAAAARAKSAAALRLNRRRP